MFTCEEDSHLDCEIALSRYGGGDWTIDRIGDATIRSLQYLNDFQIYVLQLSQSGQKIEIDQHFIKNEIEVEAEPRSIIQLKFEATAGEKPVLYLKNKVKEI